MKNKRAGFSLVEVVCAMAIIAIISGVVIAIIASSRDIMDISQSSIDASSEAQSIIECYISAEKEQTGMAKRAAFINKLGLLYDRSKNDIKSGTDYRYDGSSADYEKYTFYYNGKFELLKVLESENPDRAGGYTFRLELTVYKTDSGAGKGINVCVTEFAPNVRKEKIVYKY